MGLWPWRLVYPGPSNWGHWDRGAATRQIQCPSPAAGGIHLVYTYLCIFISKYLFCSAREGSRGGHWYCLCLCDCSVCLSVISVARQVHVYGCVYTCAPQAYACQEYMISLVTGWTWGHEAMVALPLSGCHIRHNVFL